MYTYFVECMARKLIERIYRNLLGLGADRAVECAPSCLTFGFEALKRISCDRPYIWCRGCWRWRCGFTRSIWIVGVGIQCSMCYQAFPHTFPHSRGPGLFFYAVLLKPFSRHKIIGRVVSMQPWEIWNQTTGDGICMIRLRGPIGWGIRMRFIIWRKRHHKLWLRYGMVKLVGLGIELDEYLLPRASSLDRSKSRQWQ